MAGYNYAALAGTMKIEDITSDKHNQTILQRLKDNDTSLDKLLICEDFGIFVCSLASAALVIYLFLVLFGVFAV